MNAVKESQKTLDNSSGLLIMDWAMKYLPRYFLEAQTDWFGKRGFSWHVSVLYTRHHDELMGESFVHFFQSWAQDAASFVRIPFHIHKEKSKRDNLKYVSLRSDNAGCYQNGSLPVVPRSLSKSGAIQNKNPGAQWLAACGCGEKEHLQSAEVQEWLVY